MSQIFSIYWKTLWPTGKYISRLWWVWTIWIEISRVWSSFCQEVTSYRVLWKHPATTAQDLFLANRENKARFLKLLSDYLKTQGVYVETAKDDADGNIVRRAENVEEENPNMPVIVIGEDIDLLVLAIALTPQDCEILFHKPGRSSTAGVTYSSEKNSNMKEFIPHAHAFTGCDSTRTKYLECRQIQLMQTATKRRTTSSVQCVPQAYFFAGRCAKSRKWNFLNFVQSST